jgi:cardiolipin synthase
MQSTHRYDNSPGSTIIDFFNYYTSGGPLEVLTEDEQLIECMSKIFPAAETVRRYRQELGGVFVSLEQIVQIPGLTGERLAVLEEAVCQLDAVRLHALAPQTSWNNRVDAYVNGPDSLDMMLAEIRKAARYIHLSVMLFFNDQAGNLIGNALVDAAARGVEVRVMANYEVTRLHSLKSENGRFDILADRIASAGGKVLNTFHVCYNNGEWEEKRTELAKQGVPEGVLFRQDLVQAKLINGLDVVNHRKFIIIDGESAIMGSQNIGDMHLYRTPIKTPGSVNVDGRPLGIPGSEEEWHDGCFRIHGAAIEQLHQLFYSQWVLHGGDIFDAEHAFYCPDVNRDCGEEQCTLFICFPGNPVNLIQQYYLDLITYAQSETIIVNPYLIDNDFWKRLKCLSSKQSKRVAICNPLTVNDIPINQLAVRCNMYKPLENGIAFYDYSKSGRFSHWKIAYDKQSDSVFHGSYNLNTRSAEHDFEMGMLVTGKSFAGKIRTMIEYDLRHSEKIEDEAAFYKYPLLHPEFYLYTGVRQFC